MRTTIVGNKENGFILITVILMVLVLSLIGITGMIISSNEVLIAGHINKSKEAFYITEAALEEAKYFVLNDPAKGLATSVGPGTLTDASQAWVVDEWVGMQVVDNAANGYNITANDATSLTLSGDPIVGTYFIVFRVLDTGESGINGVGAVDQLIVPGKLWADNQWAGYLLVDSASAEYTIVSNTAETLNLTLGSGIPASGTWTIYSNVGGTDSMTVEDLAYTLPAYLSNDPIGWILVDSNNNRYNVDDAINFGLDDITLESGNPAHGTFTVSRPAWMYDARSPLQGDGSTSTWTKSYTIGSVTGNVTVTTLIEDVTERGLYEMTAVGTIVKSKKAISISISDTGNGDALFTNWQEITPP